jgi:hypothetical protein
MFKKLFNNKIDKQLVEVFLSDLRATTTIREDKQVELPFLHSERNTEYVRRYIDNVSAYQRLFEAHCKRIYAPTKAEIKLLWELYVDFLYKNI